MSLNARLPTLDGLRAIAVGIVMLSHMAHSAGAPHGLVLVSRLLSGEIGVQIFFTISGFIITHLLLREQAKLGSINLGAFWYRRALRIVPPLVVLLGGLFVLDAAGWIKVSAASQWASLFFVRNHVQGGWFNGHLWSLSVEEQFYLAWPLVMVVAMARGWRLPFGWLILATIAVRGWLAWSGQLNLASYGLIGNVDALMLGCWGAWHFAGKVSWPDGLFGHVARAWPLIVLLVMGMSFAKSSRYAWPSQTLEPAVVGCLTIAIIRRHLQPMETMLFKVLNLGWMGFVGRMSYSLYLWQQLFLCPAGAWQRPPGWLVQWPLNVLCALGMGWLSFALVEGTAMRFRARMMDSARGRLTTHQ
jgi:peptidoglycan/LPS O-acetylase OafA/YrhL